MKIKTSFQLLDLTVLSACAALVVLCQSGCKPGPAPGPDSFADYEAEERAAEAARTKDLAWKATYQPVATIWAGEKGKSGAVHNFCLNNNGDVLVCFGGQVWLREGGSDSQNPKQSQMANEIRVFSPEGELKRKWPLEAQPQAICVHQDGAIYVGGGGKVFKLGQDGKVLASVDTPVMAEKTELPADLLATMKKQSDAEAKIAARLKYMEERRKSVTGMAVTDKNVFVACSSPTDYSYCVYRLDRDLKNPKLVVTKLGGCCGQMDIQATGEKLWVAHNGRHLVEAYDPEGKQVLKFGKNDRKAADGFGGCCEPKNARIAPNGDVLTAESGPPVCVKRFTSEGKFVGVLALPKFKTGCVRTTVDISADEKRLYILSPGEDAIHVMAPGA